MKSAALLELSSPSWWNVKEGQVKQFSCEMPREREKCCNVHNKLCNFSRDVYEQVFRLMHKRNVYIFSISTTSQVDASSTSSSSSFACFQKYAITEVSSNDKKKLKVVGFLWNLLPARRALLRIASYKTKSSLRRFEMALAIIKVQFLWMSSAFAATSINTDFYGCAIEAMGRESGPV